LKFFYFPGCKVHQFMPQYDRSVQTVLSRLGVELIHCDANCCGYPVRHRSLMASVYSAARILALASRGQTAILTPCKCCYGNLKHARYWLAKNERMRRQVNGLLGEEGLVLDLSLPVRHLLSVLKEEVGIDAIKENLARPLLGLKVAAHYGCHALRPSGVVAFDNPLAPTIFEELVSVLGATPVDWPLRLECCGNPLWEKNNSLSLKLMQNKVDSALGSGADILCTACTYCQIQFDPVRFETVPDAITTRTLPSVLYSQLLGLALGFNRSEMGLDQNAIRWDF